MYGVTADLSKLNQEVVPGCRRWETLLLRSQVATADVEYLFWTPSDLGDSG